MVMHAIILRGASAITTISHSDLALFAPRAAYEGRRHLFRNF